METVEYQAINPNDLLCVITIFGLDLTLSMTRKTGINGYIDLDVEPNLIQRLIGKFVGWLNRLAERFFGPKHIEEESVEVTEEIAG